jgi:hypothetical protein
MVCMVEERVSPPALLTEARSTSVEMTIFGWTCAGQATGEGKGWVEMARGLGWGWLGAVYILARRGCKGSAWAIAGSESTMYFFSSSWWRQ